MADEGSKFYVRGQDCGRDGCAFRFDAHQHLATASAWEGVQDVAKDVVEIGLRLSEAEEQLQVACGMLFDAGRAAAKAKWKDRGMEAVNNQLRVNLRAAHAESVKVKSPSGPFAQLRRLGQKLFAERRAYRAGVEATLAEMRAVVRRNEELTLALGLMTKRAAIADELLGRDASGSALSTTLAYAAELLGRADVGERIFAELLREKAQLVRTLAAYPGGPEPKDESSVPDASYFPDGHTPHGGQVFLIADREVVSAPGAAVEVTALKLTPEAADGLLVPTGALDGALR